MPALESRTLLHLPLPELLLHGVLDNRGMILITAGYGLLWQVGLLQPVWDWAANGWYRPDLVRDTIEQIAVGEPCALGRKSRSSSSASSACWCWCALSP